MQELCERALGLDRQTQRSWIPCQGQGTLGPAWVPRFPAPRTANRLAEGLHAQAFAWHVSLQLTIIGKPGTLILRLPSSKGKTMIVLVMSFASFHQKLGYPSYMGARLKKPAYGMNDAATEVVEQT